MPTFVTPLRDGQPMTSPEGNGTQNALMRFYGNWAQGVTVYKDSGGVWRESLEPYLGGATHATHNQWIGGSGPISTVTAPDQGLATAQKVYAGGHDHEVTTTEATELIAAGYTFEWWQLTDWTHSWSARDSQVDDGRTYRIQDRRGDMPMKLMPGAYPLLGAEYGVYGPLPGPIYLPASPRFNGRAALVTDPFPATGSFFPLSAGLSPNGTSTSSTDDTSQWFDPPNGYAQPYWVAVLARLASGANSAIWDATHGGIPGPGTGPTIGPDIFGGADGKWEVSLFGDLTKIENNHVSSVDETVLVFVQVDGANSFLEVNWRDAGGVLQTERQNGVLRDTPRYLECFLGWVHPTYWADTAIKRGLPTEDELDFIRTRAAAYMPAAASLAEEY